VTYFDVRFPQLGKATSNVEVSVDDDDDQWEYCIGRAAPPPLSVSNVSTDGRG
jgi:hypothetical protein